MSLFENPVNLFILILSVLLKGTKELYIQHLKHLSKCPPLAIFNMVYHLKFVSLGLLTTFYIIEI